MRVIWLAVIALALKDYKEKKLLKDYFFSEDFEYVCQCAELQASRVRVINGIMRNDPAVYPRAYMREYIAS